MEFVIAGCLGALVPELIRIGKGPIDGVFKTPGYWLQLLAQVALGAVAVYFLKDNTPTLQEAFALGFTSPQLVTRIAAAPTTQPPVSPPEGGGTQSFQTFVWWSR